MLEQANKFGRPRRIRINSNCLMEKSVRNLPVACLQAGERRLEKIPSVSLTAAALGFLCEFARQIARNNFKGLSDFLGGIAGGLESPRLPIGMNSIGGEDFWLKMPVELQSAANIPFPVGSKWQILAK